jgi:hypothetical protein
MLEKRNRVPITKIRSVVPFGKSLDGGSQLVAGGEADRE